MKVRVCPKCGKHNDANTFNCADCGTTLSMKTLVDLDSGKLLNVKPIAGYTELADISPYFEKDVEDIIKNVIPSNEKIVGGCNITHLTRLLPLAAHIILIGSDFLFGYMIITDQRLVCVYFTSDMVFNKPTRPCLEIWATHNSVKPIYAVQQPGYELSQKEKSSQQSVTYLLNDLDSIRMESIGAKDVSLPSLHIKLRQGNETSITFLGTYWAEKAHKLLVGNQEKQPR